MYTDLYLLGHSTKNLGRGVHFPQHQKMSEGYDYDAYNSVRKLKSNAFSDFYPNFTSVVLSNGVTLNDLISSAPIPYYVLLVNKKFLDVVEKFNLPPFKIYDVSVIHGADLLINQYYALHILNDFESISKYINFSNSVFWRKTLFGHKLLERLNVKSYDELEKLYNARLRDYSNNSFDKNTEVFWADEINLIEVFFEKYDLFSAPHEFPRGFKVSQRLKDAMEESKLTGIKFVRVSRNRDDIEPYMISKEEYTIFTISNRRARPNK